MALRILNQGPDWIAVDKPAGFFVHPHEDRDGPKPIQWGPSCLHILKAQTGEYLYPVHRLDRPTGGVLLFALTSERATAIAQAFQNQKAKKRYICVVRGWPSATGVLDATLDEKPAETAYRNLAQIELPIASERYATSRFSLLEVFPKTGRTHQIRRHLSRHGFPLIGDSIYGDGIPSRIFREKLGISGLLLHAYQLEVPGLPKLRSNFRARWHKVFDLFGCCPC